MTCRIFLHEDRLAIEATFSMKDACKAVPGARWDKGFKVWTYPATPGAARAIHEAFPPQVAVWDEYAAALLVEAERIAEAQSIKASSDLPDVPNMKTKPWAHQRTAFWYVVGMWGDLPK